MKQHPQKNERNLVLATLSFLKNALPEQHQEQIKEQVIHRSTISRLLEEQMNGDLSHCCSALLKMLLANGKVHLMDYTRRCKLQFYCQSFSGGRVLSTGPVYARTFTAGMILATCTKPNPKMIKSSYSHILSFLWSFSHQTLHVDLYSWQLNNY